MSKSFAAVGASCPDARRRAATGRRRGQGKFLAPATAARLLLLLLLLSLSGCSQGPSSQLQQCRTQSEQLQQRLADERQLRKRTELEIRRLADRLAESEKELARNFEGTFAERPRLLRGGADSERLVVPPPSREPAVDATSPTNSGRTLPADGWRPSGSAAER